MRTRQTEPSCGYLRASLCDILEIRADRTARDEGEILVFLYLRQRKRVPDENVAKSPPFRGMFFQRTEHSPHSPSLLLSLFFS